MNRHIQLKKQCSKFPVSLKFDIRTLIKEGVMDENKLESYFDPDLVKFINTVTTSKKSERVQHSQLYTDMKKLRTFMIISLLCYNTNPSAVFLLTLIGLFCYAYGLRDKGFEIMNAFGCSCSIDQVRRHGDHWADKRSVTDELDSKQLWRVSFDNLNFKMKYSKDLVGDAGPKRALTGQVVFSGKVDHVMNTVPSLKVLSQKHTCICKKHIM